MTICSAIRAYSLASMAFCAWLSIAGSQILRAKHMSNTPARLHLGSVLCVACVMQFGPWSVSSQVQVHQVQNLEIYIWVIFSLMIVHSFVRMG